MQEAADSQPGCSHWVVSPVPEGSGPGQPVQGAAVASVQQQSAIVASSQVK